MMVTQHTLLRCLWTHLTVLWCSLLRRLKGTAACAWLERLSWHTRHRSQGRVTTKHQCQQWQQGQLGQHAPAPQQDDTRLAPADARELLGAACCHNAAKAAFATAHTPLGYSYHGALDPDARAAAFPQLHKVVYLDHAATTLYSRQQLQEASEQLLDGALFGNPHSRGSTNASEGALTELRAATLRMCCASAEDYEVVLTSGATGALKLAGECFPWTPGHSRFCYAINSHNSTLGIRELALAAGASAQAVSLAASSSSSSISSNGKGCGRGISAVAGAASSSDDGCPVPITSNSSRSAPANASTNSTHAETACSNARADGSCDPVAAALRPEGRLLTRQAAQAVSPASNAQTQTGEPGTVYHLLALPAECNFTGERLDVAALDKTMSTLNGCGRWAASASAGHCHLGHHGEQQQQQLNAKLQQGEQEPCSREHLSVMLHAEQQQQQQQQHQGCRQGCCQQQKQQQGEQEQRQQPRHQWLLLLDAAKACATHPPDLSACPADFAALSYYKIFGYPTGLGALLVRRPLLPLLLQRKRYFGGGAVAAALAEQDFVGRRQGHEGLEDGTQSFLAAAAALAGFRQLERLGGFGAIDRHVGCLALHAARELVGLRHANRQRLVVLHCGEAAKRLLGIRDEAAAGAEIACSSCASCRPGHASSQGGERTCSSHAAGAMPAARCSHSWGGAAMGSGSSSPGRTAAGATAVGSSGVGSSRPSSLEEQFAAWMAVQGPVLSFSLLRPDGSWVGHKEVERLAAIHGICLRTGCFCNPGACSRHLSLSPEDVLSNYEAGHVCWDDHDIINGRPTGAVRASLGYMSTYDDVAVLLGLLRRYFLDSDGSSHCASATNSITTSTAVTSTTTSSNSSSGSGSSSTSSNTTASHAQLWGRCRGLCQHTGPGTATATAATSQEQLPAHQAELQKSCRADALPRALHCVRLGATQLLRQLQLAAAGAITLTAAAGGGLQQAAWRALQATVVPAALAAVQEATVHPSVLPSTWQPQAAAAQTAAGGTFSTHIPAEPQGTRHAEATNAAAAAQATTAIPGASDGATANTAAGNAAATGVLSAIYLYPIKSCAAQAVGRWPLGPNGLLFDREWALVDELGAVLTQKRHPRLALVRPTVNLAAGVLTVHAPEAAKPLQVPLARTVIDHPQQHQQQHQHQQQQQQLDRPGMQQLPVPLQQQQVRMCGDTVCSEVAVEADSAADVAAWFEAAVGVRARLVRQVQDARHTAQRLTASAAGGSSSSATAHLAAGAMQLQHNSNMDNDDRAEPGQAAGAADGELPVGAPAAAGGGPAHALAGSGGSLGFANEGQFLLVNQASVDAVAAGVAAGSSNKSAASNPTGTNTSNTTSSSTSANATASSSKQSEQMPASTHAALEEGALRYRPNLVVSGFPAFAEDAWFGLQIGGAALSVAGPCARCEMLQIDQRSGLRGGSEVLAVLAANRRQKGKLHFGLLLTRHAGESEPKQRLENAAVNAQEAQGFRVQQMQQQEQGRQWLQQGAQMHPLELRVGERVHVCMQ